MDRLHLPAGLSPREWVEAIRRANPGSTWDTLRPMAAANDPFTTGTPAQIDQADWFASLWDEFGFTSGVHLRRIHYRLVSTESATLADGSPYVNDEASWQKLNAAASYARYLGLVDVGAFVDRKNPDPICHFDRGRYPTIEISGHLGFGIDMPDELPALPILRVDGEYGLRPPMRYHVEIWCEKTTMNDILEPIVRRYRANLITGQGHLSITACHDLILRAKHCLPVRVLYISDFDPAGESMPVGVARKLEYFARCEFQNWELDIQCHPIALTAEQVLEYNLPPTPVSGKNGGKKFMERHDVEGATELDALEALHPGELESLVASYLDRYVDLDYAATLHRDANHNKRILAAINEQVGAQFEAETEALREQYETIRSLAEEFDAEFRDLADRKRAALSDRMPVEQYLVAGEELTEDDPDVCWHEPPHGDEIDDVLLDTNRTYLEQRDVYKAHQGKPTCRKKRSDAGTKRTLH